MNNNKNVDIKFNKHDPFLESTSSFTLKVESLLIQMILKSLGEEKKQCSQNELRSPMPKGDKS